MLSRIQFLLVVTTTLTGLGSDHFSLASRTDSQTSPLQTTQENTVDDLANVAKDLANQVHLLTNIVGDLKKEVAHLTNTMHPACDCEMKNVSKVTNKSSQNVVKTESYEAFYVKEIKKTIHYGIHTYVNYSVTFSHNGSSPFTSWNHRSKEYVYTKLWGITFSPKESNPDGNFTSSAVTSIENRTKVSFVFGTPQSWYVLWLNNSVARNMTLTNVTLPERNFVLDDEILYTRGKNASVLFTMSNIDFSYMDEIITKDGSNEFIDSSRLWHLASNTSTPKGMVLNVTINTSKVPIRGVFTFKATLRGLKGPPLEEVNVYKRVAIHPRDALHPFREDLFVFNTKYTLKDEDGSNVLTCLRNRRCTVRCPVAVGSNKTLMSVSYFQQKGFGRELKQTSKIVEDPFYATEFAGDVQEGVETAYCNATDLRSKRNITQTIKIKWVSQLKVKRVWMSLVNNGKLTEKIRVHCTAQGTPIPQMRIRLETAVGTDTYYDLKIKSTSGDTIEVFRDFSISRKVFKRSIKAHCVAWNGSGLETDWTDSKNLRYWRRKNSRT